MNSIRRVLQLLTLKCEGATLLASRALDERLSPLERFGLRAHLLVCAPCRRFRQQIALIRDALRATPATPERDPVEALGAGISADAKARITAALQRAMDPDASW